MNFLEHFPLYNIYLTSFLYFIVLIKQITCLEINAHCMLKILHQLQIGNCPTSGVVIQHPD